VLREGALRPHGFFVLDFGVRDAHTGFGSSILGFVLALVFQSPSVSLRAGDKIGEKARTV
jgi:hypothetical protein